MIFILLQTVLAKQLTNLTTHVLFNKISESEDVNIVVTQQLNIRDYPQAKYVIDAKLESEQKGSSCLVKQGSIQFGDYSQYSQKYSKCLTQKVTIQNYYQTFLICHCDKLKSIITLQSQQNTSNIVGHEIQLEANHSFQHLRQWAKIIEPPQIIYTDQTQYIYLIYRNQILGGKVNYDNLSSFVLRNITNQGFENDNNYLGQVKVFGWHVFVPIGVEGLDIYQYEENGELTLIGNMNSTTIYNKITNIKIVDVVFGGYENEKYMYVLDQLSGITRFIVTTNSSGFAAQLDTDLGFIAISHGTTLAEHNNSFILVLQERGVISSLVEIGLYQNDWFKVKVHYLTGIYSEIDILPEFTILRGKDEHRIIRTGIFEQFEPTFVFTQKDNLYQERQNSFYEEYVFIPSLITMDFYDVDKGALNITNNFNYNITNSFLIGITSQSIVYMPYIIENPYIRCNPRSNRSIGRSFDYKLSINATHCPQKEKLTGIPPQLILCQYVDQFNLKINNGDGFIYNTESLASIMMGFIVLLIVLSILLAYLYSRYRVKKNALQNDIQGFGEPVNREGYDMGQQYQQS